MNNDTTADEQTADVPTGREKSARLLALLREQDNDLAGERWIDPKGAELTKSDGSEH